jgi:hypothetical protein
MNSKRLWMLTEAAYEMVTTNERGFFLPSSGTSTCVKIPFFQLP